MIQNNFYFLNYTMQKSKVILEQYNLNVKIDFQIMSFKFFCIKIITFRLHKIKK